LKGYKEQLPIGDFKFVKRMTEVFRKIVQQELAKAEFDRKLPATIVSVGSGVANIKLNGGDTEISNVKVRDGLTLSPNDEVYVTLIRNSATNMFIDLKK
jgi:hypothetical protein